MKENLQKVLIIGLIWPEPEATAAGIRTIQIIKFFKEHGFHVTFSSSATKSVHSIALEEIGVNVVPIRLNHESFDHFIKELQPQIVVFDRFLTEEHFGWRVAEHLPDTIRIIDTQDLHSLRKSRENAFKEGIQFTPDYWRRQELTKREIASVYRSDLSLIISFFEIDWLQKHLAIEDSLLCYFPFAMAADKATPESTGPSFQERKDFVFIGNGKHAPNTDAITYLKHEIWPLIKKEVPQASLHIYGAYMPPKIKALNNAEEHFFVHGWAEDVKEIMQQSRVNLAPLRYGAGLKGKLFMAASHGTPSVTSAIGAEGTHLQNIAPLVGTDTNDFAQKAIAVYQDCSLWNNCKLQGTEMLHKHFNKVEHEAILLHTLQDLQANLREHREQNFTGSMLLHHNMASSKYLSKWISLKQEKSEINADPDPIS